MFAILSILLLVGYSSASKNSNDQEQHTPLVLYELIIGTTHQDPSNIITVINSDHKSKKMKSFTELANLLSTVHSRINHVTLTGVGFNYDMIKLLTSVDSILWTGNLRLINCDFTQLKKNDIMEIFRHVLKTESLQLVQNPGLTSEVLNQALTERIFNSSLSVIGDAEDDIRLKPELLMDFLHNPTHSRALLTINPGFVDGGINKFVELIVKRFQTDTEPVSFHLQLIENVILALLSGSPLHNEATDEYLYLGELEVKTGNEVVRKQILCRSSKAEMDLVKNQESSHHSEL